MNGRALHPVISRPLQAQFLTIPQAPLCYWLRERFFELLGGRTLGDVAVVPEGLGSCTDDRFLRFWWEVFSDQWAARLTERRWVALERGGGFARWFGHQYWAVEWAFGGRRLKQRTTDRYGNAGKRVYGEEHYFKPGWTYSYMASGSLGLRWIDGDSIISYLSPGVLFRDQVPGGAAAINCRISSALVRSVSAKIQLNESYVARVPLPEHIPDSLAALEAACIALKRHLVALDPTERSFGGVAVSGASLGEAWRRAVDGAEAAAAVLHAIEGLSEREVFAAYGITDDDLAAVLDETGTPAGWFPLLADYDTIPDLPRGLEIPSYVLAPLSREPRRTLSASELSDLKCRLRALYEAGPGAKVAADGPTAEEDDVEGESDAAVSGARIPIPAETFLEELSQRLEVHPISVCWLLRDLREKDGAVCQPELQRFVEDHVSVLVLRLLGHRWPRQVEAGESIPAWADKGGIIPITSGTSSPTLLSRVRERIVEDLGSDRAVAIEQEFRDLVGESLEAWLASTFFPRHFGQFKKRPIAWQIESAPVRANERRRRGRGDRRAAGRQAPAFSCLVYYHEVDEDLLPKLRAHYLGPLVRGFQTELGDLERFKSRTAEQDTRRLHLEETTQELKELDRRFEAVITGGFRSDILEKLAASEPLDRWTSRADRVRPPTSRDALLQQEIRYDPDLNDGVRVNIAPLQRAGVLAADVLPARDVENAIGDRAGWRADERRWCRQGKLPRPGWWPPDEAKRTTKR